MSPVVLFKLTEALVMCHTEYVKDRKPPFVCFPGFTKFRKGIRSLEKVCVWGVCVWYVCLCVCVVCGVCVHAHAFISVCTSPAILHNHPPSSSECIQEKSVHFNIKQNTITWRRSLK